MKKKSFENKQILKIKERVKGNSIGKKQKD